MRADKMSTEHSCAERKVDRRQEKEKRSVEVLDNVVIGGRKRLLRQIQPQRCRGLNHIGDENGIIPSSIEHLMEALRYGYALHFMM